MREERIERDGIPARLYDPGDARGVLLLGHGGAHSKDSERFVRLSRTYAEQTRLAVVCIDAVDHGERKLEAVSAAASGAARIGPPVTGQATLRRFSSSMMRGSWRSRLRRRMYAWVALENSAQSV